jgi:hypothetical protein
MALVECIKNAPIVSMIGVVKIAHRSIVGITRAIAMLIANFLNGFDTVTQHTIIEKVLSHDLLM